MRGQRAYRHLRETENEGAVVPSMLTHELPDEDTGLLWAWLGELENVSLGHGVSLIRWRSGSFEHPHDTPPYLLMPSPTFAHISRAESSSQ